ncbi:MAG TPA: DNA double-strand break repair nuclease NurA [Pyrinomonadaceae bacterium]|nr:DNA double-strand break repair nuclease NurA [Pyrinomonadaceae bacterium]
MLYKTSLSTQLQERREEFLSFDRVLREDLGAFAQHLYGIGGLASDAIRQRAGVAPGALPSVELDESRSAVISFNTRWHSHEEARRWALDILLDRVTGAADGSQYLPGREISLPVAAVQVAFFENPHTRQGKYVKEARLELVTPAEIMQAATDVDSLVGFRRFREEVRALQDFLERQSGWRERGERMPLGLFDGTLLISYARPRNAVQDQYVDAVVELITLSKETGVPLVGYIDYSYARDLVNLLEALGEWKSSYGVYDAQVLRAAYEDGPLLKAWGDRTTFFYCERKGLGDDFLDENGDPLVGFTYLQTTADGMPARLDIPSWIFEAGLLQEVLDAVRAECVVGNGYPYALETADAAAVITAQDRARILQTLQMFAEQEKLGFRISRKAMSKSRRR